MYIVTATQIFGCKVFKKKAATLEEAIAFGKAYAKGLCNIQLYKVLDSGKCEEVPYKFR